MDTATLFAGLAAFSAILSAAGTLTLAYVTHRQTKLSSRSVQLSEQSVQHTRESVEQSRQMVEEMKADREARERPFIVVYLDYSHLPLLYMAIHNVGRTPARKIRLWPKDVLVSQSLMEDRVPGDPRGPLPHIDSGLAFLGPNSKVLSRWGRIEQISGDFEKRGLQSQGIDIEVSYEPGDYDSVRKVARDKTMYGDAFNINPIVQYDITPVSDQKKVNDFLTVATKTLERLSNAIDSKRRLKITTSRERRREAQESFEATMREAEEYREKREERIETIFLSRNFLLTSKQNMRSGWIFGAGRGRSGPRSRTSPAWRPDYILYL